MGQPKWHLHFKGYLDLEDTSEGSISHGQRQVITCGWDFEMETDVKLNAWGLLCDPQNYYSVGRDHVCQWNPNEKATKTWACNSKCYR